MTEGAETRRTWSSWLRPACGAALCAAALALPACGPAGEEAGEEPAAEETGAPSDAASEAGESGALDAEAWLDHVSIGRAVDPRGAVPPDRQGTDFAAGDVVYVSMAVGDAPPDAAVHVVFYGADGGKVAEDEKKVPAQASYLYFDSGDTRNWEPGTYRVEVAVDGDVVTARNVTLAAPTAAPLQ